MPDVSKRNAVFCRACKNSYPLIKQSIKLHVNSEKHERALKALIAQVNDDADLTHFVEDFYQSRAEVASSSTSLETQIFRIRVVETLLGSGIPLARADTLRTLLERAGVSLTHSSHLASTCIPLIHEREVAMIHSELSTQYICFIFDGTTRLGEAVNVVYRYCTADFVICHRLVDFTTTKAHMNGAELAQHLNEVLTSKMKLPL